MLLVSVGEGVGGFNASCICRRGGLMLLVSVGEGV